MVFRCIFFVIFFCIPQMVHACIPSPLSDEQRSILLQDAYYIGVVKIVSRKAYVSPKTDQTERRIDQAIHAKYDVELKLYNDYGDPDERFPETIAATEGQSCSPEVNKIGTVFEAAVFKRNNGFVFSKASNVLPKEDLERLRKKNKLPPEIKVLKEQCSSEGDKWVIYRDIFRCEIQFSPDGDVPCEHSDQCEGSCIADLTPYEFSSLSPWEQTQAELKFKNTEKKQAFCSAGRILQHCQAVRYGDIVRKVCKQQN